MKLAIAILPLQGEKKEVEIEKWNIHNSGIQGV